MTTDDAARRHGEQAVLAVRVVAVGMVTLMGVWAVAGLLAGVGPMPPALWSVAALVPVGALAVFWRPDRRVGDCMFLTGAAAVGLGFFGYGWGSTFAAVTGAVVVAGLLAAPRG